MSALLWNGAAPDPDNEAVIRASAPEADLAPSRTKPVFISDLSDIAAIRSYLNRINADVRGMYTAALREKEGKYWRDLATIRLNRDNGEITVKPSFGEQVAEARQHREVRYALGSVWRVALWPQWSVQ